MIYAKKHFESLIDELEIDRKTIRCLYGGERYAVIWKLLDIFCMFDRDRRISVEGIQFIIKDYLVNTGYILFRGYTDRDWRNFVNVIYHYFDKDDIVYMCFYEDGDDLVYKGYIRDLAEIIYYGTNLTLDDGDFVLVSQNFDQCMVYCGEPPYFRVVYNIDSGLGRGYYDFHNELLQ